MWRCLSGAAHAQVGLAPTMGVLVTIDDPLGSLMEAWPWL